MKPFTKESALILLKRLALILPAVVLIVWIMLNVSVILGILLAILLVISVLSVCFARPVIRVSIRVEPIDPDVIVEGALKEEEFVDLEAANGYCKKVKFSRFFSTPRLVLAVNRKLQPYDQHCGIELEVERKMFGNIKCHLREMQGSSVLKQNLQFYASPIQRNNKIISAIVSGAVIVVAFVLCILLNNSYTKSREMIQNNLKLNLDSIASQERILLDTAPAADSIQYYEELPPVHLIVITKEQNRFTDPDGQFNDPEKLNTVLMLYEDNVSGKRFVPSQGGFEPTTEAVLTEEQQPTVYNLTELYLNIPLAVSGNETATLGQLFAGEISYMGLQDYNAVIAWFREIYHIQIASVTEIPESVFVDCYGTDNAMAVNINTYFLRFLYGQYCDEPGNSAESPGVQEMLAGSRPLFPDSMQKNVDELSLRLNIHDQNSAAYSALLMLDGPSITAFGNTVRMIGTDDSELIHTAAEEEAEEPQRVYLNSIVHSNWDIVLASLLDGMTNLNNGTYMVFCSEDHSDAFSQIRSSLPPEELRGFLSGLLRSNHTLGDDDTQQEESAFYVRNLDLHVNSVLGKPNAYLKTEPLAIRPYTNRLVKISLYYCLREEKAQ